MVTTSTMRTWWSDYRCLPSTQRQSITLLGRDAGYCVKPAYDGFMALESALLATDYSAQSVWVPRACPTGISGKTCQADGTNCSLHNYGIAVDIDPFGYGNDHFYVPIGSYVSKLGRPWGFADCKVNESQVKAVEAIRNTFGEQYFRWLGWLIGDTMHFELQVKPSRTTVDWSTVPKERRFDMLAPCRVGDTGEHVKALQIMLWACGFDPGEKDGIYGPKTADQLLACRKSIGSSVTSGEVFDTWAYEQVHRAHNLKWSNSGGGDGLTVAEADARYQPKGTIPSHGHKYAKIDHGHSGTVVETHEVTLT